MNVYMPCGCNSSSLLSSLFERLELFHITHCAFARYHCNAKCPKFQAEMFSTAARSLENSMRTRKKQKQNQTQQITQTRTKLFICPLQVVLFFVLSFLYDGLFIIVQICAIETEMSSNQHFELQLPLSTKISRRRSMIQWSNYF